MVTALEILNTFNCGFVLSCSTQQHATFFYQIQHLLQPYISWNLLSVDHGLIFYWGQTIFYRKHDLLLYISPYPNSINESIPIICKFFTVETFMHIFDKDLYCIRCQLKLILQIDKQAFHVISWNILFDDPTHWKCCEDEA